MSNAQEHSNFAHVSDENLKKIIYDALNDMKQLLETTPCLSAVSLADQLNEIKKAAFEKMYAIGRQSVDLQLSEEVLKAIRALQDAFGQIIVAISPMDNVRHCLSEIWLKELES